jgi:hypothetical protein
LLDLRPMRAKKSLGWVLGWTLACAVAALAGCAADADGGDLNPQPLPPNGGLNPQPLPPAPEKVPGGEIPEQPGGGFGTTTGDTNGTGGSSGSSGASSGGAPASAPATNTDAGAGEPSTCKPGVLCPPTSPMSKPF